MTPYDAWRTNVDETNEEAWQDAVDQVAHVMTKDMREESVNILANADEVLNWLCHAIEVPQVYLHDFRDLIKLASSLRNQVEAEMKANRKYPDAD